ncbi:hypothetical protein [Streptomyces tendae]|uniref:hypothetical protein n=1 Tax=Streptomyces tendae TaxID=1932 RepID=UPI0036C17D14
MTTQAWVFSKVNTQALLAAPMLPKGKALRYRVRWRGTAAYILPPFSQSAVTSTVPPHGREYCMAGTLPLRQWVRATADAIVGVVTGPAAAPGTLLLGQYDDRGALCYIGRTTSLACATAAAPAGLLTPAEGEDPWTGRGFTAAWGSRDVLDVRLVDPHLVVEVAVDVTRDAAGRWRHPVQMHRAPPNLPSRAVAPYGA